MARFVQCQAIIFNTDIFLLLVYLSNNTIKYLLPFPFLVHIAAASKT